jgi:hypothetical protein
MNFMPSKGTLSFFNKETLETDSDDVAGIKSATTYSHLNLAGFGIWERLMDKDDFKMAF